jgi:hypothetical protein
MSEVENEDFVDAEQDTDLVKKDVTVEGSEDAAPVENGATNDEIPAEEDRTEDQNGEAKEDANENDEGEEIPIEINEAPKTPAADEEGGGEENGKFELQPPPTPKRPRTPNDLDNPQDEEGAASGASGNATPAEATPEGSARGTF